MKKVYIVSLIFCLFAIISCGTKEFSEYKNVEIIPEVPFFDAIITYPEFSNYKDLSELIKNDALLSFETVVEDSKEWWENYNSGFKEFFGDEQDSKFGFDVSCIVSENKKYLSVLKTTYGFTGGPHGFTKLKSYTINKKNKKIVELPDLVGMTYQQISDYCRDILKTKLIIDQNEDNWLLDNIYDGTQPSKEYFQTFTVTGNSVIIHFEEYTVAPYVFGEQEVEIPLL